MRKPKISRPTVAVLFFAAGLATGFPAAAGGMQEVGGYRGKDVLNDLAADRDAARGRLRAVMEELRGRVAQEHPDLLERLHMNPPLKHGYRLLPRVDANAPLASVRLVRSVFSLEAWSKAVPRLVGDIDALGRRVRSSAAGRPVKLVTGFEGLRKRLRLFEKNLKYHGHWQQAVIDYSRFFAGKKKIAALARRLMETRDQTGASAMALRERIARLIFRFRRTRGLAVRTRAGNRHVLPVTVVTDVENEDFLARFRDGVEQAFNRSPAARARGFEIALTIRTISPATLYPDGAPAVGAAIDLKAHVGRFPDAALVLTTGAESTHAFAGRYIALGPSPVTPRVLAHEFGHLLGFNDTYVRSYEGDPRDAFGVVVIEWSGLFDDLMGAPGSGRVSPRMIDTLITNYLLVARALKHR